jgi:antitoxin CptB
MVDRRAMGELERRRLRWRARRGLLENDILLNRFLERSGETLGPVEVEALGALLELPDNELLDLLLTRKEPHGALDNNAVHALLGRIRASRP